MEEGKEGNKKTSRNEGMETRSKIEAYKRTKERKCVGGRKGNK